MKTSFEILFQKQCFNILINSLQYWFLHNKLITAQHNKLMDYGNNCSAYRIKIVCFCFVDKTEEIFFIHLRGDLLGNLLPYLFGD